VIELTPKSDKIREQITKIQSGWTPALWPFNRKFRGNFRRLFHYSLHGINEEFEDLTIRAQARLAENATKVKPRG